MSKDKKKTKVNKKETKNKNNLIKVVSIFLYVLSAICIVVASYNLYYSNRVLPGVYLGNSSYSGVKFSDIQTKIELEKPNFTEVKLKTDKDETTLKTSDLGFSYNVSKTSNDLKNSGRGGLFTHLTYTVGFFKPVETLQYNIDYNEDKLNVAIATYTAESFPINQNAHFYLEGEELKIKDADFGKNIDQQDLKDNIISSLSSGQNTVSVSYTEFKPTIFASDLKELRPVVETLMKNYFAFKYQNFEFFPSNEQILKMFEPVKVDGKVTLQVDESYLHSYVAEISEKVNILPKALVFKEENGQITFEPPITGLEVDVEKTSNAAKDQLNKLVAEKPDKTTVDMEVKETKPDVKSNEYGITELIGEGESWFVGSIPSRVSNIKTASEKIKGTLVKPGEEFSFNQAVGPIDAEHGFNDAYVISKGRTVLGNGGGVCQVSTTVFRAALNSGLPITARSAHAYRVGYYEQKSYVGLDATIYQPSVDFRFRNDTENYILVYTVFDQAKSHLIVKIYGTGDGRTVELTTPKMLSQIAPPATIYEDTNDLPKGVLQQVEWSAWGGAVEYFRTVKSADGEVMYQDKFKSYYTPWPAVFKRGV